MVKQFVKKLITLLKSPINLIRHNKVDTTSWVKSYRGIRDSTIGKWCFVHNHVGMNHVEIGNYCSIAEYVQIGGMEHGTEHCSTSTKLSNFTCYTNKTIIGHDVWIGANCIIRQGVKIGDGAVIGTMSFVNKDVPPYAIVYGIPAKVARIRLSEDVIRALNQSHYWELPPEKARIVIDEIEARYMNKTND